MPKERILITPQHTNKIVADSFSRAESALAMYDYFFERKDFTACERFMKIYIEFSSHAVNIRNSTKHLT